MHTTVAEIGQAELDKENAEPETDQTLYREDVVEGNVDEAPMDQGSPIPSTTRDAPDPERFDISSRHPSPKRRINDDDMEDESQDKKPRPRSPTISYRTDAESVGSNMDDRTSDDLDDTDKKILSVATMGIDITEIYSLERLGSLGLFRDRRWTRPKAGTSTEKITSDLRGRGRERMPPICY